MQRRAIGGRAPVRIGQPVGQLARDEQREIDGQSLAAMGEQRERAAQVAAIDVLEREEVLVTDAADLEDLRDVYVLELDRDLGLVDESRDELLVGRQVLQHLLDHRELLEPGEPVLGKEDLPHAAARQALDEQVPAEHLGQARILTTERCAQGPFVHTRLQGYPNLNPTPLVQRSRCLLYTSDAADERSSVDLGGRRIIK